MEAAIFLESKLWQTMARSIAAAPSHAKGTTMFTSRGELEGVATSGVRHDSKQFELAVERALAERVRAD